MKMMPLTRKKYHITRKRFVIYAKRNLVPMTAIKNATKYEIILTSLVNIGALLKMSVT